MTDLDYRLLPSEVILPMLQVSTELLQETTLDKEQTKLTIADVSYHPLDY